MQIHFFLTFLLTYMSRRIKAHPVLFQRRYSIRRSNKSGPLDDSSAFRSSLPSIETARHNARQQWMPQTSERLAPSLQYITYILVGLPNLLNLRGLIWLLMMVCSKRGNIDTAALVTVVQCNTLVARCSRQLIGPADWVFVTLGLNIKLNNNNNNNNKAYIAP